jgi:hypothetical protein
VAKFAPARSRSGRRHFIEQSAIADSRTRERRTTMKIRTKIRAGRACGDVLPRACA